MPTGFVHFGIPMRIGRLASSFRSLVIIQVGAGYSTYKITFGCETAGGELLEASSSRYCIKLLRFYKRVQYVVLLRFGFVYLGGVRSVRSPPVSRSWFHPGLRYLSGMMKAFTFLMPSLVCKVRYSP